jgi:hypothetical protein
MTYFVDSLQLFNQKEVLETDHPSLDSHEDCVFRNTYIKKFIVKPDGTIMKQPVLSKNNIKYRAKIIRNRQMIPLLSSLGKRRLEYDDEERYGLKVGLNSLRPMLDTISSSRLLQLI